MMQKPMCRYRLVHPRLQRLEARCQPATLRWTGAGGADIGWSNPNNWDMKVIPGTGDSVLFTTVPLPVSGANIVDIPFSIAALNMDATWPGGTIVKSNLTIAGGKWESGEIVGDGGTLTNTGTWTLANAGTVTIRNGITVENNGTILMTNGPLQFGQSAASTLNNNGEIRITGPGDIVLVTTVNNSGAGLIDIQSDADIEPLMASPPGKLNNTGIIRKSMSAVGVSVIHANLASSGMVDVQMGQLNLRGSTFSNAKLMVATNAVLDMTDTLGTAFDGMITGSGGGKVVIDESVTTLMGDTKFDFKGDLLQWSGGAISVNNFTLELVPLSLMSVAPISLSSVLLSGPGTFRNLGTISHTGSGNVAAEKGVTIENSGTYEFQSDGDILPGVFGPAANITGDGIIRKMAGSLVSFVNVPMTSTGDFEVQVGELELRLPSGSLLNGPDIMVAAGAILDLAPAGFFCPGADVFQGSGLGVIQLSGGTLSAQSNLTLDFPDGMLSWLSGTIDTAGKTITNSANRFLEITGTLTHNLIGGGKFLNNGTVRHTGTGDLLLNTAGTLIENTANYIFESSGDLGPAVAGIGEVINKGLIRKIGAEIAKISLKMTSDGDFDVQLGQLQFRLPTGSLLTDPAISLSSGASVDLAGSGTFFAIAGTMSAVGVGGVLLSGGTLFATQDSVLQFAEDMFQWTGGTMDTNGKTITNAVSSYVNMGAASLVDLIGGGKLLNLGSIFHTGTGDFRLKASGTILDNVGEYIFEAGGRITAAVAGVGTFISDGLIRKLNSGIAAIEALMMSTGDFEVQAGELEIKGNGTTVLTSCDIDIDAGATLDLTGGTTVKYAGEFTIAGAGDVVLSGGELSGVLPLTFRWISGTPEFHWSGGTINTNGNLLRFIDLDFYIDPIAGANVTLSGGGQFLNWGNVFHTGAGNLRINDAGTSFRNDENYFLNSTGDILFAGAAGLFENRGLFERNAAGSSTISTSFSNSGNLILRQGALTVTGPVSQIAGMSLTGGSWQVLNSSSLNLTVPIDTNQANVRLDGVGASFNNFFLDTNSGTFELSGGCDFANSFGLKNSGTITLGPASTLTTTGNATNTGTIQVQIDGAPVSGNFGVWSVTKALALGGTLVIQRPNGFVPTAGSTYKIHTYASQTLDYANVAGLVVTPSLVFDKIVSATDTILSLGSQTAPIVKVQSVQINDGSAQRSLVTSIKVTFDQIASFLGDPAAAFRLTRTGPTTPPFSPQLGQVAVSDLTTHNGQTVVTLTFSGGLTESSGSLIDGNYELRVLSSQVANFDGNNDGMVEAMDDYVSPAAPLPGSIHRLFGDANGDRIVSASDFNAFRLAYGGGSSIFDFNNDGVTSASDFNDFRLRYGIGV